MLNLKLKITELENNLVEVTVVTRNEELYTLTLEGLTQEQVCDELKDSNLMEAPSDLIKEHMVSLITCTSPTALGIALPHDDLYIVQEDKGNVSSSANGDVTIVTCYEGRTLSSTVPVAIVDTSTRTVRDIKRLHHFLLDCEEIVIPDYGFNITIMENKDSNVYVCKGF